jgi:hypothetical protein
MTLTYKEMASLFPNRRGAYEPSFMFKIVTALSHIPQEKGIFIPLFPMSGSLKQAINNGAVGTLWDQEAPLPLYTPNSFMVFYTNDLWKGLENMLELHNEKCQNHEQIEKTKFVFFEKDSLKDIESTYDIAEVMRKAKETFAVSTERESE